MRQTSQTSSIDNVDKNPQHCWWMQAGIVDYKLCDRDYDCEQCPFDSAIQGNHSSRPLSRPGSLTFRSQPVDHAEKKPTGHLSVTGVELSPSLFYHQSHTWARVEEAGRVRTGVDDFGQRLLGRLYRVSLPAVGDEVKPGHRCWSLTHKAGETSFEAPFAGFVKETNQQLLQCPALLNRDPYGLGWTVVIEPYDLKGSLNNLMFGAHVHEWSEREFNTLSTLVNQFHSKSINSSEPTFCDGGLLTTEWHAGLSSEQIRAIISSFFPASSYEGMEVAIFS